MKNDFNTANYKSATMDKLPRGSSRTRRSRSVRAAAIRKALRLAAVDVPYIPIWYQDIAMAVNSKFDYRGFGHVVPVHAVGPGHLGPLAAFRA